MKVSAEAKQRYAERIKEYQTQIKAFLEDERRVKPGNDDKSPAANLMRMRLAKETLSTLSYYILMNSISMALLGVKNESYLNEARKCCYKAIIYAEEVVSGAIDVPFSEYEEQVLTIGDLSDRDKLEFVSRLGYSIDTVRDGLGENSKWKWSFVEIEGRYAGITKNLLNLKTLLAQMDPRVDGYVERQRHLGLAKTQLLNAADRYHEKYELSTHRLDDMKLAVGNLAAAKRIHALLGEADECEVIQKKIDIWRTKMETDLKKSRRP